MNLETSVEHCLPVKNQPGFCALLQFHLRQPAESPAFSRLLALGRPALWFLYVLGVLLLAGCAAMRTPDNVARSGLGDFAIEARFVLRLEAQPGEARNSSGRLTWKHTAQTDQLLLATPLGQGMAELTSDANGARLRLASGEARSAANAEQLLEELLGYSLPLRQLPAWLLGRSASGTLSVDRFGRPLQLQEDAWRIDYAYDDERPEALPARLILIRDHAIELRLRIEEWQTPP